MSAIVKHAFTHRENLHLPAHSRSALQVEIRPTGSHSGHAPPLPLRHAHDTAAAPNDAFGQTGVSLRT